jgi:hypothetical protein
VGTGEAVLVGANVSVGTMVAVAAGVSLGGKVGAMVGAADWDLQEVRMRRVTVRRSLSFMRTIVSRKWKVGFVEEERGKKC